ncbi:MAG: T9SS type A sorting domain-containing protein [Bacteroidia bacterium]|nr:T9SS type A sorting domain-containing protein [Bacteroidia bacterium]
MKYLLYILLSIISLQGIAQVSVMNPIIGSSVICSDPSVAVSYTASASNSPLFYNWEIYPSNSAILYNDSSAVLSILFPQANGTYTLNCSATNAFGTSSTTSFVINVFETPDVTFSGTNTFCQGSSTNLSASSTIGGASSTIFYNWAPSYGLNTTSGQNVIANPATPNNYTVTASNGICSSSSEIMVAPFETMSVTFSGANTFCQGSSTNLSASSTIQSGSSTIAYFWAPSYGLSNTFGQFVTANPAVSTNYTVTAYYGTCFNTGQITVGPNGFSPSPIAASASNSLVCFGDSIILTALGANTYTWTNGVQNAIPFSVYYSNTYYVTGTDNNGCTSSASVNVNVDQLATFNVFSSINPIPPGSGQSATLTINGSASTSYSVNGVPCSTSIVVTPTTTTTYTITSANSSGCEYTVEYTQFVGFVTSVNTINNNSVQDYFKVYPNPNNGQFTIKSSDIETIKIINQLGENVRVINLNPEEEVQVSNLSVGIYVIHSNKSHIKIIVTQ